LKKVTRDQVIAAHLGVAIGDALGAPVETLSRAKIKEILGPDGVTGYLPAVLHKHEWARGLAKGATTDDWALTAAMAEAIIKEPGGVSLCTCIDTHLHAFHTSPFGFGKTTHESMVRWEDGATILAPLYSHKEASEQKKSGNGTVMKLIPAAILGITKGELFGIPLLHMSSRVTHQDTRSIVLAYAVYAYATSETLAPMGLTPKFVSEITQVSIAELDGMTELSKHDKMLFAADIARALSTITPSIESLPSRFTVMETAPFVISVCQRARSFKEGVLLSVNAGGDTDTNASIVGGILGLRYGTKAIPQEWIDGCLSSTQAIELAHKLCDALDIV
jgi:ADP-ribosylglycohydrolase